MLAAHRDKLCLFPLPKMRIHLLWLLPLILLGSSGKQGSGYPCLGILCLDGIPRGGMTWLGLPQMMWSCCLEEMLP